MSDNVKKADIDKSQVPPHAPETRDEIVQEHRQRRVEEPAAASMATDAESGGSGERKEPLVPPARTSPATTSMVAEDQTETRETRAGPGDAGGQHSPRMVPQSPDKPRAGRNAFFSMVVIGLGVLVLMVVIGLLM